MLIHNFEELTKKKGINMKVIVIGGGPAGMMAAISSGEAGNDVTILEKMESLRKKVTYYRKR